jgi:hypothetical protein
MKSTDSKRQQAKLFFLKTAKHVLQELSGISMKRLLAWDRAKAFAKMGAEVLLQFSFPCSTYLPGIQHGLECCSTHWFDD